MSKPEPILWLSDARGQYIPRDFAESFERSTRDTHVSGVSAEDWAILEAGPDHEHHFETWDDVLRDAVLTGRDGTKYTLHQDGDLWAVPVGMEWSDEQDTFVWPDEPCDACGGTGTIKADVYADARYYNPTPVATNVVCWKCKGAKNDT